LRSHADDLCESASAPGGIDQKLGVNASQLRHGGQTGGGELDLPSFGALLEFGAALHEDNSQLLGAGAQEIVVLRARDVVGVVRHPLDRLLREEEIEATAIARDEAHPR